MSKPIIEPAVFTPLEACERMLELLEGPYHEMDDEGCRKFLKRTIAKAKKENA